MIYKVNKDLSQFNPTIGMAQNEWSWKWETRLHNESSALDLKHIYFVMHDLTLHLLTDHSIISKICWPHVQTGNLTHKIMRMEADTCSFSSGIGVNAMALFRTDQ